MDSTSSSLPTVPAAVNPLWLTQKSFTATTPLSDKIYRVANIIIFAAAIYSFTGFTAVAGIAAYGFYAVRLLALRKIVATILGHVAYPATFDLWGGRVDRMRESQIRWLEWGGLKVNRFSLYKSGTKYDAILITHESTMNNGKWNMHALGSYCCMEQVMVELAAKDFSLGFNALLINGPGVGQSWGSPTRYQMGAAFEAGLQFLEQDAGATHISMEGFSLGAGMLGEAILQHDFTKGREKGIHYQSISDRTFCRLSTVGGELTAELVGKLLGAGGFVGALAGTFVKYVGYAAGIDLDGVGAAKKLSDLNIPQIVIQHHNPEGVETRRLREEERYDIGVWHNDGIIPDNASLGNELSKDPTLKNKRYLLDVEIDHNDDLPATIKAALDDEKRNFAALA